MKASSQLWENSFIISYLFALSHLGFANAAIAGVKVNKLIANLEAADGATACSNAYSKSNVRPSLGACVSTAAASGRRLFAVMYDAELLFSSTELSEDALTAAVNSLKADEVQGVTSDASVDPFALMKTISGIASNVMATFETETASAATEAKNVASPHAVTASRSH